MSSGYDHRNSHSTIVFRLGRHLLVILPLHASDALRPSNGSRDLFLLDGVARCDCSDRDTPSTTDAITFHIHDGWSGNYCGGCVPTGAIASRYPVKEENVSTPVRRSERIRGMKMKDYKEVSPRA
jgi:hypothetical protein